MIVPRTRLIGLTAAVGGAITLVCAFAPGTTLAMLASAAILIVAVVIDAVAARRTGAGLSVATPALIRAVRNRAITVPVTLSNAAARGAVVPRVALGLPFEFSSEEQTVNFGPELAADQQTTLETEVLCGRRGEYRLPFCTVRTQSPLGLWAVQNTLPLSTIIRVYPDLLSDGGASEFLHKGSAGSRVVRHTGKGREFEKLREYSTGDAWDEIDWKATARRGKPVVRVFQMERTQEIYVAIDNSRLSACPAGHELTLERSVNAALVMALAAESQGDRFGLITFSDRVHSFVRAGKGKAQYRVCREAIYQLQPRVVEPDFGEFFAFLQTRLTRRALVIVLTTLDDPLAGETFGRHVALASRRHLVIAGMPTPEGARPVFEGAVATVDDIYGRLGGHLRWRQLAELRKSCGRQGVALHLLDPEKLSSQLAGIYLDVKRRQSL